ASLLWARPPAVELAVFSAGTDAERCSLQLKSPNLGSGFFLCRRSREVLSARLEANLERYIEPGIAVSARGDIAIERLVDFQADDQPFAVGKGDAGASRDESSVTLLVDGVVIDLRLIEESIGQHRPPPENIGTEAILRLD
ncbi:hypothetical protein DBT54_09755, partial [Aerococcus loyolae]